MSAGERVEREAESKSEVCWLGVDVAGECEMSMMSPVAAPVLVTMSSGLVVRLSASSAASNECARSMISGESLFGSLGTLSGLLDGASWALKSSVSEPSSSPETETTVWRLSGSGLLRLGQVRKLCPGSRQILQRREDIESKNSEDGKQ